MGDESLPSKPQQWSKADLEAVVTESEAKLGRRAPIVVAMRQLAGALHRLERTEAKAKKLSIAS